MAVYTNDLRLKEIATGDEAGTWGTSTNTNLELISEAFSFGTEAITTNADTHTTTIADGSTDPGRSLFLKYTGTLDSTCTITIGPNTVSKLWFIENATSGSQSIIIKQGSGATVTIANGQTKAIYSDGAGSGGAMVDAFTDLSVPSLFVSGDLDVDGTTNLDVVDIDGAVDFASTTAHAGNATFADNAKAIFGSATDLSIYSDGTNSYIQEGSGTSGIRITTDNQLLIRKHDTENIAAFNVDGAVRLFHDSSQVFSTTSSGIDVTGSVTYSGDLVSSTAGTSNVRVGVNAGNSITSGGNFNVVVGDEAGTALTTGDNNVAIGFEALKTEDANGNNVAVGYRALKTLNAGAESYSVAVGADAGTSLTTGIRNTLVGAFAGDGLTDADFNTALGYGALDSDTLGSRSVAIGYAALEQQNFTTATNTFNVAVGYQAGKSVTTGQHNILVGNESGDAITDGTFNTALGSQTLSAETRGGRSVAVGHGALFDQNFTSPTDVYNVAVGYLAGANVTTGIQNTLIGGLAGDALTDADFNTALGYGALSSDTLGSQNTALGFLALSTQNFTTATNSHNVAIGSQAGSVITTGVQNTLIGSLAGDAITTGTQNILIGYVATASAVGAANQTVIGAGVTSVGNGNFTFGSGTSDSNVANGATTITAPSDERYKEDITDSTAGLSFINDLRPVTYKWKKEKDIPTTQKAYVEGSEKRVMNDYTNHGFIAQEVKAVIDNHPELKDGFDMWMEDEADGRQRLGPSALIPVLVKAIQELTARVAELES